MRAKSTKLLLGLECTRYSARTSSRHSSSITCRVFHTDYTARMSRTSARRIS